MMHPKMRDADLEDVVEAPRSAPENAADGGGVACVEACVVLVDGGGVACVVACVVACEPELV